VIQGGRAALDQVRQARVAAAACGLELGFGHLVDDIELVTTELVTNAVLHGGGLTRFHLRALPTGVRIEVADQSTEGPVLVPGADDAGTGRGLVLVAKLAERWGVERTGHGKVLWAEVTGVVGTSGPEITEEPVTAEREPLVRVELGAVPTDLLTEAKAHVDTLLRELTLISVGSLPPAAARWSP